MHIHKTCQQSWILCTALNIYIKYIHGQLLKLYTSRSFTFNNNYCDGLILCAPYTYASHIYRYTWCTFVLFMETYTFCTLP